MSLPFHCRYHSGLCVVNHRPRIVSILRSPLILWPLRCVFCFSTGDRRPSHCIRTDQYAGFPRLKQLLNYKPCELILSPTIVTNLSKSFYRCTVHSDIHKFHSPTDAHLLKTLIITYIKIRWPLHVSVYDLHQGACN